MMFILLTLTVIFTYCYFYSYSRRRYLLSKIPGPPGLPLFGNFFAYLRPRADLWNITHGMADTFYPIYKVQIFNHTFVNIRHPDDAQVLLSSIRHISKSNLYNLLHPWFKTGLLTSTGSTWQHRRKILTPAFHFNVLREFVTIFEEQGQRMVNDIKETQNKDEHDLLPLIAKYTLNIICETAMGTSLEVSTTFHNNYRKAIHEIGDFIQYSVIKQDSETEWVGQAKQNTSFPTRPASGTASFTRAIITSIVSTRVYQPWLHNESIFNLTEIGRKHNTVLKTIQGFTEKVVRGRQQYHDEIGGIYLQENDSGIKTGSKKRLAMLDLLIAAMKKGDIDEPGIREEVDTFMYEGHDTIGMGICFALLLLAEHKHIQQRAREEIDTVLEKSGGKMGIPELQQLAYLDRCIKEALRLYPSVPLISRLVTEDLHLKNYTLPKGVGVRLNIYALHRDPNFWPDPLTFEPDRFLPERSLGRHPFAYIPFSAGSRNCIGQKFAVFELKSLIGHLLHNFYLEPIDLASEVRLHPDIVLRPSHPIRIKFVQRSL